jgi:hypothetical protein
MKANMKNAKKQIIEVTSIKNFKFNGKLLKTNFVKKSDWNGNVIAYLAIYWSVHP